MDIPLTEPGSSLIPGEDPELAPGVEGYAMRQGGVLWIPFIAATRPGSGDVSRFLDALPRDETVRFPNVLSERLAGMLARRGFVEGQEFDQECGEVVPYWERRAAPERR